MSFRNEKRLAAAMAISVAALTATAGSAHATLLTTESFSLPYGPSNPAAAPYMDEVANLSNNSTPSLATWGEKGAIGLQGSQSIYPSGNGYVNNPPSIVAFKFNIGSAIDSLNSTYGTGNWTISNPTLTMQYTYYSNNPVFGGGAGTFETYVVQNNSWYFSNSGSGSPGNFSGYVANEDPNYSTSASALLPWSGGQADLGSTTYNWLSPADNPNYTGWFTDKTGNNQGLLTDTLATAPLLVGDIISASAASNPDLSLYLMPNNSSLGLTIFTGGGTSEPTLSFDVVTAPANLVWANTASANGDGKTWDIGNNTNWNNGTTLVAYTDGANVTFDDSTVNAHPILLNTTVSPNSMTINTIKNTYTITGTGSIAGTGSLTLASTNTSVFTLATTNSYTGGTFVDGGTLLLDSAGAFPSGTSLNVSTGASVTIANHGTNATYVPTLSALNNGGTIDITNNAMVIHNGSAGTIFTQIQIAYANGTWTGTNSAGGVITSSVAASDTTHLTAVGFATGLTITFQGQSVTPTEVLIKYTYYGDASLDGKIDGSDYSRIDNGYLDHLTGWFNGDFNYDGVIDGSDYTLIDNTFNSQGTQLTAEIAAPAVEATDQIAQAGGSFSVPEPSALGLLATGAIGLLGRLSRRARDFVC